MKIAVLKGNGIIAPHVIEGFTRGFRDLQKHDVIELDVRSGFGSKELNLLINFNPDFCVSYGFLGCIKDENGQFLLRRMHIPLICLHYDNVFFSMSDELVNELKRYEKFYYHFIWDNLILELFKDYGLKNAYPILLGTDLNYFKPVEHSTPVGSSLAFVGSIGNSSNFSTTNNQLVNNFVDDVITQKLNDFDIPALKLCMGILEKPQYIDILSFFRKSPWRFWSEVYLLIHMKGSAALRQYVLDSIGGVDIHIYGASPWSKAGSYFHEKVPYHELSEVYQRHAINLNISSVQLETSVNNRVFDCFASKAFVLSDYKAEMKSIFPQHWEAISFRNMEELGEKGEYYFSHEKERKELTEELFHVVVSNHTYTHRAAEIIDRIAHQIGDGVSSKTTGLKVHNRYRDKSDNCPVCGGEAFTPLFDIIGHDDFRTQHFRCEDCCVVFMNPMPTDEYLDEFYNSIYYSKEHREKMGWDSNLSNVAPGVLSTNEIRMDLVESFFDASLRYPKGSLLDIGCSTGNFLLEARSRYWKVEGIEISDKAAQQGRTNYGLEVKTGVLNKEQFDQSSFDVVTAWDVLEHISDPQVFLEAVYCVLKPRGLFVLNTPNISSTASYFAGDSWRHLDPPLHVILYDHISIGFLLKKAGFEVLQISSGKEYLGQMQVIARKA